MGYCWSDSLAFIDLERKGPDRYVARRQILQIKPDIWIVFDNTIGNENQITRTVWTTSYHINLSKAEFPDSYLLKAKNSHVNLTKIILTSKSAKIRRFKGSVLPFAGWESHKAAPAIVIEQPASNSWAAAIWLLQESERESNKLNRTAFVSHWKSPDDWSIVLSQSTNDIKVLRKDNFIIVKEDAKGIYISKKNNLTGPPQITDGLSEIHVAYENAARKYPRKKYKLYRYQKATYLLLLIFIFIEAFFLMYKKFGWKYHELLRTVVFFFWVAVGILLFRFYL
jgi:hypothetical protein